MFDIDTWMRDLTERLREAFGSRLVLVGLQGSYGRGEAGPDSDIDVVTVLDTLSADDLDAYRAAVRSMPECGKACGFICGAGELKCWPRHELVQFESDIAPVYGSMERLIPACGREDLAEAVRIGAANLYHALCHSYLYGRGVERLKQRCKEAFFVLRAVYELRSGEYVSAKRELLCRLDGDERIILEYGMGLETGLSPKEMLDVLLRWVQSVLAEAQSVSEEFT